MEWKEDCLFVKKVRILKYFQIVGTWNVKQSAHMLNIYFKYSHSRTKFYMGDAHNKDLKSFFNIIISIYFSVSDINWLQSILCFSLFDVLSKILLKHFSP